jgi:hypothetical protein
LATFRLEELTMLNRLMSCGAVLMLLAVATPVAAQDSSCGNSCSDRDLLNLPNSGGLSYEDRSRLDELKEGDAKYTAAVVAEGDLRQKLLRLPPLPDERNGLLGTWSQEDGGQLGMLGLKARNGDDMVRELWETLQSNPDKLMPSRCVENFGNGVTFAPSTYTSRALDGSRPGGPIAYRSGGNQVIWVIPDNLKPMPFKIVGPDRILLGLDGSCALVRVGTPAANAAANATTAPSATPAAELAATPFKSVREQLGVYTVASVERDIKARGSSLRVESADSQGKAYLGDVYGDYSDIGSYVSAVNYAFDGTGPAARLIRVVVVHGFHVFGDEFKKLVDERKAVLAKDVGVLKVKSATESSGAGGGYVLTLVEKPDSGYLHERYELAN